MIVRLSQCHILIRCCVGEKTPCERISQGETISIAFYKPNRSKVCVAYLVCCFQCVRRSISCPIAVALAFHTIKTTIAEGVESGKSLLEFSPRRLHLLSCRQIISSERFKFPEIVFIGQTFPVLHQTTATIVPQSLSLKVFVCGNHPIVCCVFSRSRFDVVFSGVSPHCESFVEFIERLNCKLITHTHYPISAVDALHLPKL